MPTLFSSMAVDVSGHVVIAGPGYDTSLTRPTVFNGYWIELSERDENGVVLWNAAFPYYTSRNEKIPVFVAFDATGQLYLAGTLYSYSNTEVGLDLGEFSIRS